MTVWFLIIKNKDMKKIFLIVVTLLASLLSWAQFPSNPTSGNVNWNTHNVGATTGDLGICAGTRTDTAAWNLVNYVKTVPFIIVNTSNDGATWRRNSSASGWDKIATGATGVTSVGLTVPSPSSPAFSVSGSPVTGAGTLAISALGSTSQYIRGDGSLATTPVLTNEWHLTGNAGTNPGTNFVGTTDNKGIMFKTNNIQSGYIDLISTNASFGSESLMNNTSGVGTGSVAFGTRALKSNTVGGSNTAVGANSLRDNIDGSGNTAIGGSSMLLNVSGANNTAVGVGNLQQNTGSFNSAIGESTLLLNAGDYNTALGSEAMFNNDIGSYNTSIGSNSGKTNTTGHHNTYLGDSTGYGITTGSNNTILGARITGLSTTLANNIILADGSGNVRMQFNASGNPKMTAVPSGVGTKSLRIDGSGNVTYADTTSTGSFWSLFSGGAFTGDNTITQNGKYILFDNSTASSGSFGISQRAAAVGGNVGFHTINVVNTGIDATASFDDGLFTNYFSNINLVKDSITLSDKGSAGGTSKFSLRSLGASYGTARFKNVTTTVEDTLEVWKYERFLNLAVSQLVTTGADKNLTSLTTGAGVQTALTFNIGSAGSFVVNGGALGTPSSGTGTNITGITEGGLSLTDITTNNSSTSKHGFLLKLNNSASSYMDGTGAWSTPAGTGVTSVSGTTNRITVATGTTTPVIDISASYVGQSSITTLGTIGTGVWQGTLVGSTYGGTGVNNGSSTITLGGNLVTSGAFATTLTSTATTNATLPAGTNTLYSTKSASITSAQLLASLSDPTGTGVSVFGTSPALTTSVTTPSTTFALLNTTATTINAFGAATTVNTGASATQIWNFGGSTTASEFRFLEPSGSGTNYSAVKAVAQAGNITYSLPPSLVAGGALTDVAGNGTLTWVVPSGSGITGSGSTNNIPKFTSSSSIGNSALVDNASTVTSSLPLNVTGSGQIGNFGNTTSATWFPLGTMGSPGINAIYGGYSNTAYFGQNVYYNGSAFINPDGTQANSMFLLQNGGVSFYTGAAGSGLGSQRFAVTSAGLVGIGAIIPTEALDIDGNLKLRSPGGKLIIATGTNASIGTATLSGGTVTVSTTAVTASSKIFLTDVTTGSLTNVGSPTVGTVTAGTSFVINSTNPLDASLVNWIIYN